MKNVLVLNFFPALTPPSSGGELRYYYIYKELSRYYDITLLSPTFSHHRWGVMRHSKTFREYRIPKTGMHEHLHKTIRKEKIGLETSALECALSARFPNTYHEAYLRLYQKADVIIHESPYVLDYDLFFGFDDKPRVYNSYNCESFLVRQMWSGPHAEKYRDYIRYLEKRLVLGSDVVFSTSGEEKNIFIREFGIDGRKVAIASNGINPEEGDHDVKRRIYGEKALFIGSAHPPNVEAVNFILDELSKKCPCIDFFIAGNCCDIFNGKGNPNVFLLGKIDEKKKKELFRQADIAINPMFSGSGTNLKSLEFLSSGIPLISTGVGVRGLDLVDGKHFVLAERDNFAATLNKLSKKTTQLQGIARNGQMYINKNYSWKKIVCHIHRRLETLRKAKKRVILVINDFEVSKPMSGGEVRINRIYTRLSTYNRVLLFCLNSDGMIKRTEISKHFTEISIPKTVEHVRKEHKADCEFSVSVKDIITSHLCKRNGFLFATIRAIESSAAAVIFVHPYMAPLLAAIKNRNVVYESINCELSLKSSILAGHPRYREYIKQVEKIERMICERSRLIISVSNDDHPLLERLAPAGREIRTIENGAEVKEENPLFDCSNLKGIFDGHPAIVFMGSAHEPNAHALNFILNKLAPQMPHCYFIIIGSVCTDLNPTRLSNNILPFGNMDEDFKDILMRVCDVAINPMLNGSGSNLKLAEFFACKIPVVTTPIGARGYEIKNYREAIICSEDEFKEKILEILNNKKMGESLATKAFFYVKKNIEWRILAKKFHEALQIRFFEK
jgi:glycosyltransferase involved in cell wall biosynthesis